MGKHYKVEEKANIYVQLYDEVGRLGSKISRSGSKLTRDDQRSFYYLMMLEFYVNGALLQGFRIKQHRERMRQAQEQLDAMNAKKGAVPIEELRRTMDAMRSVMNDELVVPSEIMRFDIHYYAICLDKITKLHPKLLNAMVAVRKDESTIKEIRRKKKTLAGEFKSLMGGGKDARDFLEHIDERIGEWNGGKSVLDFTFHQQPENHVVTYNHKYSFSVDPDLVTKAYGSLVDWIESLPDLK